jgi:hypothetical protein
MMTLTIAIFGQGWIVVEVLPSWLFFGGISQAIVIAHHNSVGDEKDEVLASSPGFLPESNKPERRRLCCRSSRSAISDDCWEATAFSSLQPVPLSSRDLLSCILLCHGEQTRQREHSAALKRPQDYFIINVPDRTNQIIPCLEIILS